MITNAPLLSAQQVAERLNVSRATVYRWANVGLIPQPFRRGRLVRFDPAKLEQLIADRSEGAVK